MGLGVGVGIEGESWELAEGGRRNQRVEAHWDGQMGGGVQQEAMTPLPLPQDYQRMLDLMRDIILATDLAHHLRIFKDLQKMAEGDCC